MGLVDLHRATGERKYLELAGIFVDMRGSAPCPRQNIWEDPVSRDPHPGDQNQNRVPLRKETEAVGHAVTAMYLYAGATDVVALTGEAVLREALLRVWRNVVERKQYVTGAVGAYHNGLSVRGDRVHEAFAADFELPNRTAYNETCANIGNAMWNWRLLKLTGDAAHADVMERVLYNSALSAMDLGGTRFCYTNPLARAREATMLSHDTPERWFTHKCYCCPPQVLRTLAGLHDWAYGVGEGAVWVNLYGGSRLDTPLAGGRVRLTQTTRYPWDGQVALQIDEAPGGETTLCLRIPGWCRNASVRVNGKAAEAEVRPGSYSKLRRIWKAGDRVELDLPMPPRFLRAHYLAEELHGQVAVARGPVVYCLESADLPKDHSVFGVALPPEEALRAVHDKKLLGGVTVIEAAAVYRAPQRDGLYGEVDGKAQALTVRLVPYYAWCNRGAGDMTVWLPTGG